MALEEINNISDLVLPLFAFYLIVFCNFTKELIGCRIQSTFDTNMYGKHFVGFILLFFLIIMVDPNNMEKNLFVNFGYTLLIYILFIVTTKLSFPIMVIVLLLLLVCYILSNIAKKRKQDGKDQEYQKMKTIQNVLFIIISIISVVGFLIYLLEKYREYGATFSIIKFIFGTVTCRNHTPKQVKII